MFLQTIGGHSNDLNVIGDMFYMGSQLKHNKRTANYSSYVDYRNYQPLDGFSARELLEYTVSMKSLSCRAESMQIASDLIATFNLTAIADKPMKPFLNRGISEDQMKRVRLCCQLIMPPPLIFLDEPTSGLDSSMSYQVLTSLKEIISLKGKELSAVLSIHQPAPRLMELFDSILVLGGGGMLFFGNVSDATFYLSSIGYPVMTGTVPIFVYLLYLQKNIPILGDIIYQYVYFHRCFPDRLLTSSLL